MDKIGTYESMFSNNAEYALSKAKTKLAEVNYKDTLDKYQANGGNVMLQFLEANKPQKDAEKEARIGKTAKFQALSEALGMIGKGIGAFNGVNPAPSNHAPLLSSMGELQRINDIYDYDTKRWQDQSLRATLQKNKDDQDMQQFNIGNARQDLNMALGKEAAYASALQAAKDSDLKESIRLQKREWDVEDRDVANKSRERVASISRSRSRSDNNGRDPRVKVSFINDTGKLVELSGPEADKLYNDGVKAGVIPSDKVDDVDKRKTFNWKTLSPEQKNNYYRKALNTMPHNYDSSVDPVMQSNIAKTNPFPSEYKPGEEEAFKAFLSTPEIVELRKKGIQDHTLYKTFLSTIK